MVICRTYICTYCRDLYHAVYVNCPLFHQCHLSVKCIHFVTTLYSKFFQTKTPDEDFEILPWLTSQRNPSNHRCDAKENPMLPLLIFFKKKTLLPWLLPFDSKLMPIASKIWISLCQDCLTNTWKLQEQTNNKDVNPIMFNPNSKKPLYYLEMFIKK